MIEIKCRFTGKVLFKAAGENVKEVLVKAVSSGADLRGADLSGAYLRGAYLYGAKKYAQSHDFFFELVRCQKVEVFTEIEWSIIGQIAIHRLCWDSIKKRFDMKIVRIFEVLAEAGFAEYLDFYKEEVLGQVEKGEVE